MVRLKQFLFKIRIKLEKRLFFFLETSTNQSNNWEDSIKVTQYRKNIKRFGEKTKSKCENVLPLPAVAFSPNADGWKGAERWLDE